MSIVLEELPITTLQREAALLLAAERGGIAWWKVGQGKTRIALAAFLLYPTKSVTSHLHVIARPESFGDWQAEAATMGMADRIRLTSYAALQKQSGDAVVRDIITDSECAMVCFDELYLFKNPDAVRSERARQIAVAKPTVGLSGSIMTAQRLEDVYGQAVAVNKHKRIARSMTTFREEFLIGINDFGGMRWTPQRGSYDRLMRACTSFAHVYMPKKSERTIKEAIINVDVTSQQQAMFKELQETLALAEHGIELTHAAGLIIKTQQIANGWVRSPARVEWEEKTATIIPVSSNKPRALFAKLEELIECGERVVVWCAFRYDVLMLKAIADDKKMKSVTMLGGDEFDVAKWQKCQVCFATEGMGSSVNHFGQVAYAVYYSMTQKWLDLQQSMGRTDRKNSEHNTCFYYFLNVRESMDANVLRRVRQAGSSEKGMMALAHDMREWLNGRTEGASEKETGDVTSQHAK